MLPLTGTLLIPSDLGAEWGSRQATELARRLEQRLNQRVALCSPNDLAGTLLAGIADLVNAGVQRVVALPLGLVPIAELGRVRELLVIAGLQWPLLTFHVAAPLTWLEWGGWIRLTGHEGANELRVPPTECAMLLVGQGESSPLTNANLARVAHLVLESSPMAWASYAFCDSVRPPLPEALQCCSRLGYCKVVVVPWLIADEVFLQRLRDELASEATALGLHAALSVPKLAHPALVNILVSNHFAALSDAAFQSAQGPATSALAAAQNEATGNSQHSGLISEEAFELQQLERRINALLPPEYQERYEDVTPRSMGTASLKYDNEGNVAWDQIWTSFCDLALAGGPPHRGTLLEPVTAAEALAEPERYQVVVAEIERGIRLTTSLPAVASRTPGWVGVRCESEEMAIWLMRAIIVENVMVRREGDILFLPAGPTFTVHREIKNVVTAIAKTVHYWKSHLTARRLASDLES